MTPCPDCERFKTAYQQLAEKLLDKDLEAIRTTLELNAAKEWLGELFGDCFVDEGINERLEKSSKVD